ncbi:sensor histidine kinase [Paraclostridium ghonii]|uniref:histidine kinase n=1 Tax=Paraclostridium ghonii TaxID=29358 RepID=A0ABU0MXU7_9FIRM|nr:sensor histidine kinase [Paeniclostridium ghonii]MDQ0555656.1 signal transduction histidine kinase [Paeniclostridium ghonii]
MDTKLKNNKLYIRLIIVMTILIASIVMVLSYQSIKKYSNNYTYNIYEDDDFEKKLVESTYGLYYKIYDENNEKIRPVQLMLYLKPGVDSEYTSEKAQIRDGFDNAINSYIENLNRDLKNLDYYVIDKSNNLTKQSSSGNLNEIDSTNKNFQESLKSKYDFYISIDFDDKGNMKIDKVHGADEKNIELNINDNKQSSLYLGEDVYELEPIKNMKFVYGVPKDLKYMDNIAFKKINQEQNSYTMASMVFISIDVIFVTLVAILMPYKKLKELKIFNKLIKIPLEIVAFLVLLAYDCAYLDSHQLMIKALNNNDIIIYLVNLAYWVVVFSIMFIGVIILKHIIKTRHTTYLKDHSLIYKSVKYINIKFKNAKEWMFDIELGKDNKKKIVSILLINLIVVSLIFVMVIYILTYSYLDGIYVIYFIGFFVTIYTIVLYFIIKKKYIDINNDYNKLLDITKDIASGNLDRELNSDLGTFNMLKNQIQNIQIGFKKAVEEEVKSQKMKTELISNVSHDLKTPLTSIITYVDLLKDESLTYEKRRIYIDTLDRKSERLRVLIEDLFEVSKVNSGNVSLNIIDVDVVSLMKQTLLEVDDKMRASNLNIRTNFPDEKLILQLDSQRMFRVFENLLINISKYAMDSSRVYIDILNEEEVVNISFKNMTAEEIDFNVEDLVERFVRGDKSRNTEGSGLGLAIAKSFVELQGGTFNVSTDGDLFKVVITLKK